MEFSNLISKHIIVSLILLFITLLFINIGFSIYTAINHIPFFELLLLAIINVGVFLIPFKLLQNKKLITIREGHFIILIGILTVVLGLISITIIDNILINDPKTYNDIALHALNEEYSPNFASIMWRRTVLYLIPIYSILPQTLISVKLTNLIISLLTTLVFYFLLRLNKIGVLTSRISVILFTIIPLRYSNINIPSHDIMGLFLLLAFTILTFRVVTLFQKKRYFTFFLLALASGIVLFALDIQRSLGLFIILTLIFTYLINQLYKNRNFKYALSASFLIILATYFSGNYFLQNSKYWQNEDGNRYLYQNMLFSYNKLGTFGRYVDGIESRSKLFEEFSEKSTMNKFSIGHYISQIKQHPTEYIKLIIRKNIALLNYPGTYFLEFNPENSLGITIREKINYGNIIMRIWFFSFIIIGLFGFLKTKHSNNNLLTLYFLSFAIIFSILMIFLSEVAPSYTFLLLPSLSILAALGIRKSAIFVHKIPHIREKWNLDNSKWCVKQKSNDIITLLGKNLIINISLFLAIALLLNIIWPVFPFKTIENSEVQFKSNSNLDLVHIKNDYSTNIIIRDTILNHLTIVLPNKIHINNQFFVKHHSSQSISIHHEDKILYSFLSNQEDDTKYHLCQFQKSSPTDSIHISVKSQLADNDISFKHFFTYK